jgi:hypothetical protein
MRDQARHEIAKKPLWLGRGDGGRFRIGDEVTYQLICNFMFLDGEW